MIEPTINDAQTIAGGGTGTVLTGRYRVMRQLGQGGMGSVWLAEDTQLDNKPFAIKMLPSILVSNKRAYRQLKDEALVAMKLTHPNIVTLRAFEENNGNPFLVMDYIDGQTLDDYLAEKEKLSEEETVKLLKPIAAALDYAHGEGVVHRDVKPANVMIRKDGHPFILDFGIAREIQETLTRVTGKLSSGTLLYMSPEQLNGEQPKKEQDIYSFAAMAYECLKGEPPFTRGAIEDQIKNKPPEPLEGTRYCASVMAGLAKKPDDRPKTCSAVLAGGNGFSHTEHKERKSGRTWKVILSILVLGFVIGGGAWFYNQQRQKAMQIAAEQRARAEAKRKAEEERKAAEERRAQEETAQRAEEDRKAKEKAKRKAEEERLEAARQAAATEIRLEAKVQQGKVERISDADGFRSRKDELAVQFSRADALFDEKVKRWSEAAQGFSNYVVNAEVLIRLDSERQKAVDARGKAEKSKIDAEQVDATKYAATRWNEAVRLIEDAVAKFDVLSFKDAEVQYGMAKAQFDMSIGEAKGERDRQAAEAKEQAERKAAKEAEQRRKNELAQQAEERRKQEERRKTEVVAQAEKRGSRHAAEEYRIEEDMALQLKQIKLQQSSLKEKTILLPNGEPLVMVWCGPGVVKESLSGTERSVKGFWIGKYELTQKQWTSRMKDNPSQMKDPDLPVEGLSWNMCKIFIMALNANHAHRFRLPQGYEWEYAAKGGHKGFKEQARSDIAWWRGNSAGYVHLGGQKAANVLGLYDVLGNVWEWCENTGPDGVKNEIRGGAWYSDESCSYDKPEYVSPDQTVQGAGLRLVCDEL